MRSAIKEIEQRHSTKPQSEREAYWHVLWTGKLKSPYGIVYKSAEDCEATCQCHNDLNVIRTTLEATQEATNVERGVHRKKNPPWAAVETLEHYVGDVRFLGGSLRVCGLNIACQ